MKRQETRDIIINTASELFYNKGYNLTGINEIIAEAGIAKATLYSHFKSKEDLILAYLDKKDQELIIQLEAFCKGKSKGNARLVGVLEFLLPFFNTPNFNGCWCVRSAAEVPKDNEAIRNKIKENKTIFLNFIHAVVKENKSKLTPTKQRRLGNRLYLLYEAAITESHIHSTEWPIHESIDLLKELLKQG